MCPARARRRGKMGRIVGLPKPLLDEAYGPRVRPARATVVPRARRLPDGEKLPLEILIQPYISRGGCGIIRLCGASGAGKSTALAHLAAVLPPAANITLLDDAESWRLGTASSRGLVISTMGEIPNRTLAHLHLSGWHEAEWIEYMLATRPDRCDSVMARISADPQRHALQGSPRVWRIVLDAMLADDSIRYIATALRGEIDRAFPGASRQQAADACARRAAFWLDFPAGAPDAPAESNKLLLHGAVQVLLAAERIVELIRESRPSDLLRMLPPDVVEECAVLARSRPAVLQRLHSLVRTEETDPGSIASLAASILLAVDPDWRPPVTAGISLRSAHLPRARWAQLDLIRSNLSGANCSHADLRRCLLADAAFDHSILEAAQLGNTVVDRATFAGADISQADFSFARGEECNFTGALAHDTRFDGASLPRSQFSGAKLHGASFIRADLRGAVLASALLDRADFRFADLRDATFDTGQAQHLRSCGAIL